MGLQALAQSPVIGVTASPGANEQSVGIDYFTAVTMAGGKPLLLQATCDTAAIDEMIASIDGLLLSGGVDIDPAYYGEPPHPMLGEVNAVRDTFEMALIERAVARRMPILGVCRGMQVLNVALGGSLWQDLPSQVPSVVAHKVSEPRAAAAHDVYIEPGTKSAEVIGVTSLGVNSRHHQAVKKIAPCLTATAWSPDAVIEMLDGYPDLPILAVQWHPENFVAADPTNSMLRFFTSLVEQARRTTATGRSQQQ